MSRRQQLIYGLVYKARWEREWAESHFIDYLSMFEIGQEVDFFLRSSKALTTLLQDHSRFTVVTN